MLSESRTCAGTTRDGMQKSSHPGLSATPQADRGIPFGGVRVDARRGTPIRILAAHTHVHGTCHNGSPARSSWQAESAYCVADCMSVEAYKATLVQQVHHLCEKPCSWVDDPGCRGWSCQLSLSSSLSVIQICLIIAKGCVGVWTTPSLARFDLLAGCSPIETCHAVTL